MADTHFIEFGVPGDKIRVPRVGLGTMGLTSAYGTANASESVALLGYASSKGCTFWDTADIYGQGMNEALVGQALRSYGCRDKIILCTKFSFEFADKTLGESAVVSGVNGHPDYIRKAVEGSLRRLGVESIDVYYQHRVDPQVPIEETVKAMAELVKEGKVRYLGLSECSAATLRRAYAVHPIAAVQSEYNAWTLDIENNGVLDTCRELGVTLVAYSPLGRGFLSGQIRSYDDLEPTDVRRGHPRFQPENFAHNLELVKAFERVASRRALSTGQVALAWVLAQEKNLVVIPGTRREKYLDENVRALDIILTREELDELRAAVDSAGIAGERYPPSMMQRLDH
ncbi:hypothetical protein GGI13_002698 [Coemansia sp. RSA 455]|nr:hypothetical protein H4S03_002432 [Coemansia sp. S3946]KAJ2046249.1 hypothetical protein H4S04_005149 [Coemansia sp. S16]KAJ2068135.1 hypothetical protein GGH13_005027 [Coemansia sp. S155-1]KAJ2253434.1 hypothetical protein GGI13_002698 [Coemansia sp. RSA 455]